MSTTRRGVTIGVLALVALAAPPARAAWERDAQGRCVRVWTPASLGRGPLAMVDAFTAPPRTAVGATRFLADDPTPRSGVATVVLYPVMGTAGFVAGFIDTGVWLGTGLVDTLTGGYFAVAPEEATVPSFAPLRPVFMTNTPAPQPDPCAGK